MMVRQWLLQNFKKNTDMSVEEMLAALKDLGDKLERHESAAEFIKPLNMLAGYYQNQLDQLKGMQKVTHSQSENLETINKWIKEVEDLAKALNS